MAGAGRQESYFESSRGRVLAELRCGSHTVDELARALGVTPNAVRLHLQALERDGLVRLAGTRRTDTAGKPAHVYEIAQGADERFSRAYAPLLGALLDALANRLAPGPMESIAREAGQAMAARVAPARAAADPVDRVMGLIAELGGRVTVERRKGTAIVHGCGCVLGAVAGSRPVVCRAVAAMLSKAAGTRVRDECERGGPGERASCRFAITLRAT